MIFHAEKRGGFVMMDKAPLNDPRLSLKAKGLLAYLLSKPPDWRPQISDICKHCREGKSSIRAAMAELRSNGYAALSKDHGKDGHLVGSEWAIYENSQKSNIPEKQSIKPSVSTEIQKTRLSVNRYPNNNENTNNNEKPKGEEKVLYEEMRNFPPPECTRVNTSLVHQENLKFLGSLGIKSGSYFWAEWVRRSEAAPLRTSCALCRAEEDVAWSNCGNPRLKGKPIRNPSGRADWYFRNIDINSPVGALKAGSRGKSTHQ